MTVEVSVVLPAYNAADHLEQAVTKLLRQRDVTFEIVIVDDGSTDETFQIASRLADSAGARIVAVQAERAADVLAVDDLFDEAAVEGSRWS